MSEHDIILRTKELMTIPTIQTALKTMGIEEGNILFVHSSLSSLGWVCGGPQTVVMALEEAVGEDGTLVMPAQSGDWSDPLEWQNPPVPKDWIETIYQHLPAYDSMRTPTRGMGLIAEHFRTTPGTRRSSHPQVSFAAKGKYRDWIIENHPLSPALGPDSPLGKLYQLPTKVLFIGTTYETNTCFHLAEALSKVRGMKRVGTAMVEDGERVWKWYEDFDYDTEAFDEIGNLFEKTGHVLKARIGQADCRLFNFREAVDFAFNWFLLHKK